MGAWLWEADLGHTLSPPLWARPSAQAGTCREGCPGGDRGEAGSLFMPEVHGILRDLCRVPPQNTENG